MAHWSTEPMAASDDSLEALRNIMADFTAFCAAHGAVSEADTRAKVIDRVLREVCHWPEADITREDHVDRGYIDYALSVRGKRMVAVEAKREGLPFVLPLDVTRRSYKLDGAIVTDPNVGQAIYQVRGYCDDAGIRYAIATNGYAWIVFRAVRDDLPWKKGSATVFPSLEYIRDNFTGFWNLLSHEAIVAGSLHEEFDSALRVSRRLHRVVDRLFNADLPLRRNRLNGPLQPLIKLIFEDIADQDQLEVLQSCYIHSSSVRGAADYLDHLITESIPQFLVDEGTRSVGPPGSRAGFDDVMGAAVSERRGELILLLGGIGSGKTTFLKRYQRTAGREVLSSHTLWFAIDFLKAPLDPNELEAFVWGSVLDEIRTRYASKEYEKRRHLHEVFAPNIEALRATILADMKKGSSGYDRTLAPYLHQWQQQLTSYVPQLVRVSCTRDRLIPVLFVDNVDQLAPAYQAQIFLLAQRMTRIVDSLTVVSLREESYYTASVQKSFTAYSSRKFHIAAPLFRRMIGSRIKFAIQLLDRMEQSGAVAAVNPTDQRNIRNYLTIVQGSLFGRNKKIARMIEAICYGNMRLALELFSTFLTSGATDVSKMLRIQERDGAYHVAFHEFVKAIMLRDRCYYKEEQSPIMNLLNVGAEQNSSHFTALRILTVLLAFRGDSTREGRGYVEIARLVNEFEALFDNREDLLAATERLIAQQLVEVNTRSTETVEGASHIRITSGGWYYLRHLVRSFPYLDLVLQDTPFDDADVEKLLRESVYQVDNLSDKEEMKLERTRARFARVEAFLDYLEGEEAREKDLYQLEEVHGPIGRAIMPLIRRQFEGEREWIDRRLRENREKFEEEGSEEVLSEEAEMLELFQEVIQSEADEVAQAENIREEGE